MAGHKISGYAANLWKALFASFIQLIARIFHFNSTTTHKTTPQPPSQSQSQPLTNTTTHNPDSPSLCPSSPKPASIHQLLDQSFIDIEQGLDSQDNTMASKKRGQKRRGAKNNNEPKPIGPSASSSGPSNGTTDKSSDGQSRPSAPPPRDSQDSAPARATPIAKQGDTKVNSNSQQTNHQKPAASGKSGRNRGPQPPIDDKKENAIPTKNPPGVPKSQSPALKPLTAEYHDQIQKTGTRSQPTSTAPHSSGKPKMAENMPLSEQAMQHISASVERLSLDDVATPKQASASKSAVATAPAKMPVPVVVALPLSDRIGTNSAKPTLLPASHLPGLFEPKTEEERIEREYHLQYMREALAMVRLSFSPITLDFFFRDSSGSNL